MLTNAALVSGAVSLVPKIAIAAWAGLFVLRFADRRRSAAVFALLFSVIGVLASCQVAMHAEVSALRIAWWTATAAGSCQLAYCLRAWLRATPQEIYLEASQVDPANRKSKRKKRAKAAKPANPDFVSAEFGLWSVCIVANIVALVLTVWPSKDLTATLATTAIVHQVVASLMLGLISACAVETTLISSPDALSPSGVNRVRWGLVAAVATILFVAELVVCGIILLSPATTETDISQSLISKMYAISLLVACLVAWMVPRRIAGFQKTGKARDWTSLALSAWLACLVLVVTCSLPTNWPWMVL